MLGVMVAAAVTGMIVPIGIGGFFLAMIATIVVAAVDPDVAHRSRKRLRRRWCRPT